METLIDFHSHVLPGVDDGSPSVEVSIAMLRKEAEQGIRHVVATPHFYPASDSPERFLERRRQAELRLREEMEKHTGLPELHIGAEVYYFSGISHSDMISGLTIGKKGCILIEMPYAHWSKRMYQELEDIYTRQGLTPIIAHVDRYIRPFHTQKIPQTLERLPVIIQANASFFLQSGTRRMALRMLRQGQIQLIGSDCHNLKDRSPNLSGAVELIRSKLGQDAIDGIREWEASVLGSTSV